MKDKVPSPALVSFGITRECDLKCPHCYSDSGEKDSQELTTEEAKKVITDIADLGTRIIIMDGGEPTFRGDLFELIKHSKESGLVPVIGSHGGRLTKEFAEKLKAAGCRGVAISLDGAQPKTHDEWRGMEGARKGAVEGAGNCAEVGLPFQIAPLLHSKNFGELYDTIDLAKRLGANAVEIFDYVHTGRGKDHYNYELSTEQRKQVVRKVIELQKSDDITYRLIALPQYWVAVEREVSEDEILMKYVRSCCAAGTRYITILPNGDVVPCMLLQVKLGNVHEESLKTIWHESPVLKKLRNRDLLKGKCGRCKYKHVCAGARCKAYEKTGDMLAEDPTCWFSEDEIQGVI
ncbi:MAG: radical SAM protein [Deltaproteobacteria bacterium]|nr:radical SAM protein [Deltaproteobacteria bacterium]